MPADHYLPLHGPKLPTGEIRDVTGTEFDFRKLRKVGQAYDTCFCLNGAARDICARALPCVILNRGG